MKWKHFPRYWPFVRGIHRSPVNSPHKGQWRRTLMFSLICVWINGWVNNHEAGDLRRHRSHYDVIVMVPQSHRFHGMYVGSAIDSRAIKAISESLMLGKVKKNFEFVKDISNSWSSYGEASREMWPQDIESTMYFEENGPYLYEMRCPRYRRSHKSHNASEKYPTMHHFVTEMRTCVPTAVTRCRIVGYKTDALWDLWDGSTVSGRGVMFLWRQFWESRYRRGLHRTVWRGPSEVVWRLQCQLRVSTGR